MRPPMFIFQCCTPTVYNTTWHRVKSLVNVYGVSERNKGTERCLEMLFKAILSRMPQGIGTRHIRGIGLLLTMAWSKYFLPGKKFCLPTQTLGKLSGKEEMVSVDEKSKTK
jgi:hypothetical protein